MSSSNRNIDYTGAEFGYLKVIRKTTSCVREAKWFCLCSSCGKNCIVASSKLKRGQKWCSTCSFKNRKKPKNFIDLTGKKFGSLLVVKQYGRKKNSNATWECNCDCGNKIIARGSELKNKKNCIKCKPGVINGIKKYNDKEKYCPRCKEWLLLSSFSKTKKSGAGRNSYCYSCMKEYRRQWMRKHFYNITEEEFNKAFIDSNGKCSLCNTYAKLVIDHCHTTGKFRGLICGPCNSMLGRLKDNTDWFIEAISYINKHKK